jgi:hypothetical protein
MILGHAILIMIRESAPPTDMIGSHWAGVMTHGLQIDAGSCSPIIAGEQVINADDPNLGPAPRCDGRVRGYSQVAEDSANHHPGAVVLALIPGLPAICAFSIASGSNTWRS